MRAKCDSNKWPKAGGESIVVGASASQRRTPTQTATPTRTPTQTPTRRPGNGVAAAEFGVSRASERARTRTNSPKRVAIIWLVAPTTTTMRSRSEQNGLVIVMEKSTPALGPSAAVAAAAAMAAMATCARPSAAWLGRDLFCRLRARTACADPLCAGAPSPSPRAPLTSWRRRRRRPGAQVRTISKSRAAPT